jgi:predicted neuraminidase
VFHDGHLFVTAQTSHALVVLKWTAPSGAASGRIIVPATEEFPRNGESSMVALKDGSILQLYGAMNGTGDWAISVMREIRSSDGGETWSGPRTLFTDPERSLFQPSLTRMANGEIGLTYTSLLPKRGAFKLFRRSSDEGKTWSEPVKISDPAHAHTTGPWDKLYTLQSGRVIALLHALLIDDISKNEGPRGTYALLSDDHGRTWRRAPREGTLRVEDEPRDKQEWGFWEPALVEHAPGKLYLMARTSTGWLYESRSEDGGETWTDPVRSSVPNPIAPPVLTKIPGTDTLLLLHNPRVALGTERLGGHRTLLAYRASKDAGKTWSEPKTILEGKEGELWHDYPAILWHEGKLHLATRHIEIFNTNKWTKVSLRHLALPASRF